MNINNQAYRSVWSDQPGQVSIIDQTFLPHTLEIRQLTDIHAIAEAIEAMRVRGAPLIGVCAAYGLALAARTDPHDESLQRAAQFLLATRPTAINLRWALDRMLAHLKTCPPAERGELAWVEAGRMADEDVALNESIGDHGLALIEQLWEQRGKPEVFHILTHCNAGWIATVDWGTALAPIYKAHDRGIPVHVWVDETRPRNQGAQLTAWELAAHGVAHDLVVDNAGGHLMQQGLVDLMLTGTDRVARSGDVCNKIGTYLKALAAHDNGVPFWVALPGPTIDWTIEDGVVDIPIENRDPVEVTHVTGWCETDNITRTVRVCPEGTRATNPGFDVTPARLVSGLITERGRCAASRQGLAELYPEHQS